MKTKPAKRSSPKPSPPPSLAKAPTGIAGLDEITNGGLPRGRPTLLCGSAGCGKTLLAMEFLLRGIVEYGEPGVFISFEENAGELTLNFASLGYDLRELMAAKKLEIDHVHIERSEIEETGEYDLDGLFVRLGAAIDGIGAKRVVLDTVEALFAGLGDTMILRAELRRLFSWLKTKGVTAIITGERGENTLTRHGLEEYVADCVILLDNRVSEQMTTRRLRVVKYRGSSHGSSEYPFLIDEGGISILPITSLGMKHTASLERVSTGVAGLDAMLGGNGFYRGSSILISGTAGTGKTSMAAQFVYAALQRRERCLWFAFEESASQISRNMRSIGLDFEPAQRSGLLRFHAERPTLNGLEMHLVTAHKMVAEFQPQIVVIDPITNFTALGTSLEIKAMLTRLIDFFKVRQITTLFTSLTSGGGFLEATEVGVSSLMDAWLLLRDLEMGAERNRVLHLLKSRGMAHSNQVREFRITDHGVELHEVSVGISGELLLGAARRIEDARWSAEQKAREEDVTRMRRSLASKQKALEAQIATLAADFEVAKAEVQKSISDAESVVAVLAANRLRIARPWQPPGTTRATKRNDPLKRSS